MKLAAGVKSQRKRLNNKRSETKQQKTPTSSFTMAQQLSSAVA